MWPKCLPPFFRSRDEILYHAKIHPEQYSDTFSADQRKQLRISILHICQTAVDALGDASKFPKEWIFHHRWGKGKKATPMNLPTGEKTIFLTVGGRTSFVVPSVQKKTGAVAGDVPKEDIKDENIGDVVEKANAKGPKKRKAAPATEEGSPYFKNQRVKREPSSVEHTELTLVAVKKEVATTENTKKRQVSENVVPRIAKGSKKVQALEEVSITTTRRSSGRINRKGP